MSAGASLLFLGLLALSLVSLSDSAYAQKESNAAANTESADVSNKNDETYTDATSKKGSIEVLSGSDDTTKKDSITSQEYEESAVLNGAGNNGITSSTPEDIDEDDASTPLDAKGNSISASLQADNSFLFDVEISDLNGADVYYDGQVVRITGEAVGEAVHGIFGIGTGSWVTLYDEKSDSSIIVFMSDADAAKIDTFGGYGKRGSIVQVQGVFYIDCLDHQSESDIHATSVSILEHGTQEEDIWSSEYTTILAIAAGIATVMGFVYWRLRERAH
ncbi:MAG: hypothetical protein IJV62_02735 [Eggerthellaceae bacterium]|nr:hypothetical protein [Eggerthellaceae bacterium]